MKKNVFESMGSLLKNMKRSVVLIIVVVLVLVIAAFAIFIRGLLDKTPDSVLNLSSTLVDALDIDELSTSDFVYNGIADVYNDEGDKVICSVLYHAVVKAGIEMHEIEIEQDNEQKVLRIKLPEVSILSTTVDPSHIDFLPDNAKIELKVALAACREDVNKEAKESSELIDIAKENLQTVMEALALPLIEDSGYTLEW